ncbi:hypothetical protein FS749_000192 [Ceratobasidium sp. UAMH 11750]|nr:hypothetical protein FS749_000192 [Ceratobasidium sp. UAMH 11750]
MATGLVAEIFDRSSLGRLNDTIDSPSVAPVVFETTPGNEPSASDLALEPRVDFGSFSTLDLVNDQVDWQNHSAAYEKPIASASSHAVTFGSKDDIDTWVDSLRTQRKRKNTSRPELQCPREGCGTVIRRPQALKEHLYSHFNIRPYQCLHSECAEAFAIASNRDRHTKVIHSGAL